MRALRAYSDVDVSSTAFWSTPADVRDTGGPHFCLGAMLAGTQLQAIVGELLSRVPGLQLGEPTRLVSNFVHGVTSLPCEVGT